MAAPKPATCAVNVKNLQVPPRFLNVDFWAKYLPDVFPPLEAESVLYDIVSGVNIGRPPAECILESPNWPSAVHFSDKVDDVVRNDMSLNRLHGPFITPPYEHYVISPLGAFLKRDGVKVRVIHDLSYPHGRAVNSSIDPEAYSLYYTSIDNAVDACRNRDRPFLCKIDLKDAYKHVGVAPRDWHLLGFKWALPEVGPRYFFSRVLTFGLRSAPALFDRVAGALEKIISHLGVSSDIIRYVDDFLIVSDSENIAAEHLEAAIGIARQAGFVIQVDKVTRPTRCLEFLGIIIDLEENQLRISDTRVEEIKTLLSEWVGVKSASKRKLLRLIGKLAFAARVVRTGRAFIGRLIGLSKSVKALHHHIRLSPQARLDVDWWTRCINSHNGTSMMCVDWSSGHVFHVYTDASDAGMGAVFGDQWFASAFSGCLASAAKRSINWRELFTAVKALATWARELAGQKIMFHVDNLSAVHILNKLYTPECELMELVRQWCLLVEAHSICVTVVYISTHDNIEADWLSRGEYQKFLESRPNPPSRVWPESVLYFNENL